MTDHVITDTYDDPYEPGAKVIAMNPRGRAATKHDHSLIAWLIGIGAAVVAGIVTAVIIYVAVALRTHDNTLTANQMTLEQHSERLNKLESNYQATDKKLTDIDATLTKVFFAIEKLKPVESP